jgi:hypothetical protein
MPYFVTAEGEHPDCSGYAVVKDDFELMGCHETKESAVDQMVAVSLAEDIEPGGDYQRSQRAALPGDKFTTEQEALDRAEELGCEGTHEMDEDGQTIYMPCSTHGRYEELTGTGSSGAYRVHEPGHPSVESEPAPEEDQIEGSEDNPEGSASGAGNDIQVSERTEKALRNKVEEHNEQMEEDDRPDWTRTTLGQLKAVYRRGAGAYSTSHRPGVSRAAWAMARVNAYLYLLRNGEPESANYIIQRTIQSQPEALNKQRREMLI